MGRSRILPEHRTKAKEEGLVLFEVLVDARFVTNDAKVGTLFEHLKSCSIAGACSLEEGEKLLRWKFKVGSKD